MSVTTFQTIPRAELMASLNGNHRVTMSLEQVLKQTGESVVYSESDSTKLSGIASGATVGANWTTNLTNIPSVISGTTASFTTALGSKLDGIAAGAEVNVQSDWSATSGDAFILNKPSIPTAQVNSDWNSVTGVSQILNKPSIPTAQVNSDWNSVTGVSQILNKPTIPAAQLSTVIGSSPDNTNHYLIASWVLTGSWATIMASIKVMSTSKLGYYELGILASLDGAGTTFAGPVFKIKDVFGTIGTSTFTLTYLNATKTLKLFFKDSTLYEPHQIVRVDSILNSNSVTYSNTNIGATLPTETGTVTPTIL
jgi:hypothetical protein